VSLSEASLPWTVSCPAAISPTLNPLELANAELLTSQPLGNWLLAK